MVVDPPYLVRSDDEVGRTSSNRFAFSSFDISHAHTHQPFTFLLTNHNHLGNRTIGSLVSVDIIYLIGRRIYIVVKGGLFLCQDDVVFMQPV